MSFDSGKYDNMLLEILQNEGQIQPFLETLFSFLYRRTDYYKIQTEKNQAFGFPPGASESILRQIFTKYYKKARLDDERQEASIVPETTSEEVLSNGVHQENGDVKKKEKSVERSASPTAPYDADSYNGATLDNYSWSQNQTEVDVQVKVSEDTVSGRNVKVDLKSDYLVVSVLEKSEGTGFSWKVKMEGKLPYKVNTELVWTLIPGEYVYLQLEKREERLWEYLLEGEPKLDTQKMDNTITMDKLDDESQSVVQELVYNQNQKMLGKPTSKEQKMANILKDAWDLEGSPFQGQPFDMSKINMSNAEGLSREF